MERYGNFTLNTVIYNMISMILMYFYVQIIVTVDYHAKSNANELVVIVDDDEWAVITAVINGGVTAEALLRLHRDRRVCDA